ncbi:MAG: N-acetylmuramoyl-L-alanine amidase [Candidatus Comchoanobacterales bacterium]
MRSFLLLLMCIASIINADAREFTVVIDPGHGGKDPGARGVSGIFEKNITLQIAKKLELALNKKPNIKAYLTRRDDSFLTLKERRDFAVKQHADLLLSVHADAFHESSSHGMSVYTLSQKGATSYAAEYLASQENKSLSSYESSDPLSDLLNDLKQASSIKTSLHLGEDLLSYLGEVGDLHSKHVEQAAFVVLKSHHFPSILIECGFISNPQEAKQLASHQYQNVLATSIAQGVAKYAKKMFKDKYYTVKSGDNLFNIAKHNHTSIKALLSLNGLKSSSIYPGMQLRLF